MISIGPSVLWEAIRIPSLAQISSARCRACRPSDVSVTSRRRKSSWPLPHPLKCTVAQGVQLWPLSHPLKCAVGSSGSMPSLTLRPSGCERLTINLHLPGWVVLRDHADPADPCYRHLHYLLPESAIVEQPEWRRQTTGEGNQGKRTTRREIPDFMSWLHACLREWCPTSSHTSAGSPGPDDCGALEV